MPSTNPRYGSNPKKRTLLLKRFRSMGLPCHLCGYSIDYSLKTPHRLSFELDEKKATSKWMLYGYSSAQQCAQDPENVAPAHRCCNQWRGNREITPRLKQEIRKRYEREILNRRVVSNIKRYNAASIL